MGIFYREKTFHAGKKNQEIRKNDFAPSEKYACYAPAHRNLDIIVLCNMLVIKSNLRNLGASHVYGCVSWKFVALYFQRKSNQINVSNTL